MIGLGVWSNACACAREGQRESGPSLVANAILRGGSGARGRGRGKLRSSQEARESGSPGPEYEPPERGRSENAVCDGGHDNWGRVRGGDGEQRDQGLLLFEVAWCRGMICVCVKKESTAVSFAGHKKWLMSGLVCHGAELGSLLK